MPKNVKEGLKIIPVERADEVLQLALAEPLKPEEITVVEETKKTKKSTKVVSTSVSH